MTNSFASHEGRCDTTASVAMIATAHHQDGLSAAQRPSKPRAVEHEAPRARRERSADETSPPAAFDLRFMVMVQI
jgi:hypothetical protein